MLPWGMLKKNTGLIVRQAGIYREGREKLKALPFNYSTISRRTRMPLPEASLTRYTPAGTPARLTSA